MAKRFKVAPKKSRRMFAKTADKTNSKNLPAPRKYPMRGGIRM